MSTDNRKIHKAFYGSMRALIFPYFHTLGQYKCKVYEPKSETYLMLTNHNTNWDFFYFGVSLKKQMYFVASEHIFRQGFASKALKYLIDPIPRRKGASGAETTKLIIERLQKGYNVCMMADGNRSFTGETGFISPNTAKLVKESGVGLITFRLHGGYFVNPRWASETRKGRLEGEIVNEYTADELQKMSLDEIYKIICDDLYVNAYEDQAKNPLRYHCKHPAEHLETALFACPECGSFSTLESENDMLYCRHCGMKVRLNDYGYFTDIYGNKPRFETILDWDKWQQKYLHEYLPSVTDENVPLFSDDGLRLSAVTPGVGTEVLASGTLTMFKDRMEIGGRVIKLSDIEKISITLTDTMLFTAAGQYYEIKGSKPYSALKYLISSRLLIGKEYK